MKRNILHTLWAAVLLLTSCAQEEISLPGISDTTPLSITVTDGGYATTDKAATRTAEDGYRTKFTTFDDCGLYIVRGGSVVYDNVKLTAVVSAGTTTWLLDSGVKLVGGFSDESYFLYYPYQADMTGKVNASATDAEGFFAPLVGGWQPEADQSTYIGYTDSDLMTAKGTATKDNGCLKLSFSMTHRMAMAVIEMPKTVYKFTNTDVSIPDYVLAPSGDFAGSSAKPYGISPGTYRYIVNPVSSAAASIVGSYDNGMKEFTIAPNGLVAGKYKTYEVDGTQTVQKNHNLQLGDYLLSDGSLVGKDETLTEEQKASLVAIVFHAGPHGNDESSYSSTGIMQKKCHGYAVALTDATSNGCMWGVFERELGCYPIDNSGNKQDNYNNPDIDWSGYAWTRKIIGFAGGKENLNATSRDGYPATYYAVVDYPSGVTAPAGSSGWFLPSIGQMWKIYQNRSSLFDSRPGATNLKDKWYWSSSEKYNDSARGTLIVNVSDDGVYSNRKDEKYTYVRPVLAF